MKKQIILIALVLLFSGTYLRAQKKPADTVVIKVGEASKITFVILNKNDLETLKKYDIQAVVNDLIKKLEQQDTANQKSSASDYLKKEPEVIVESNEDEYVSDWSDDDEHDNWDNNKSYNEKYNHKHKSKRTYHSFNIDLGMNNYITGDGFPDQDNSLYTVKPWGSWYVGLNGVQRTRLGQKFFLESSLGVSWYNFKFENYKTQITKDDNSVIFSENPLDVNFTKSKLTATYLNAALVPMIDFGSNRRKPSLFDGGSSDSFRIGVGAYAGYRIDSYTKQVYKEDGDKTKPKDHDNFYLNNIRYGLRLQLGFDDIDLFFNYDLNELYIENKGPKLNAFSFGITL